MTVCVMELLKSDCLSEGALIVSDCQSEGALTE